MSTNELKEEIRKAIDTAPDSVLNNILKYLKQINSVEPGKLELSDKLKKILDEDDELLKKLSK